MEINAPSSSSSCCSTASKGTRLKQKGSGSARKGSVSLPHAAAPQSKASIFSRKAAEAHGKAALGANLCECQPPPSYPALRFSSELWSSRICSEPSSTRCRPWRGGRHRVRAHHAVDTRAAREDRKGGCVGGCVGVGVRSVCVRACVRACVVCVWCVCGVCACRGRGGWSSCSHQHLWVGQHVHQERNVAGRKVLWYDPLALERDRAAALVPWRPLHQKRSCFRR